METEPTNKIFDNYTTLSISYAFEADSDHPVALQTSALAIVAVLGADLLLFDYKRMVLTGADVIITRLTARN